MTFCIGVALVELSDHAAPFHIATGLVEPIPLAVLNPWPVTALQTAVASMPASRMSRPLSFGPAHVAMFAVVVVLVQVRVAPRTICVARNCPKTG
ncbi:hypothetical protein ACIF8W_28630 [Streptomyces sp. NPDC085639]|uniref:hypothetical protein n=1 Tax=unclassified Streptomyces TaxID=2593676 RepID=UPI0037D145AD